MSIENNKIIKYLHSKVLPGCAFVLFLINQTWYKLLYVPEEAKAAVNVTLTAMIILLLISGGWSHYITLAQKVLSMITQLSNLKNGKNANEN